MALMREIGKWFNRSMAPLLSAGLAIYYTHRGVWLIGATWALACFGQIRYARLLSRQGQAAGPEHNETSV